MQINFPTRDNAPLPPRMRPVVNAGDGLIARHIRHLWQGIESDFGVELEFHPDARTMMQIGREELPLFGAYDTAKTFATTMYGYVAYLDGMPVATHAVALYTLGSFDLAEYLECFGMFEGCPEIQFNQPARALAVGIRGTVGFAGNAWVARTLGRRGITKRFGELSRAIGYGTLNCPHYFYFMKAANAKVGVNFHSQHREAGVAWGGEARFMGYSGERFILSSATQALAHDAPIPEEIR